MFIKRESYVNALKRRMQNGMIKAATKAQLKELSAICSDTIY